MKTRFDGFIWFISGTTEMFVTFPSSKTTHRHINHLRAGERQPRCCLPPAVKAARKACAGDGPTADPHSFVFQGTGHGTIT